MVIEYIEVSIRQAKVNYKHMEFLPEGPGFFWPLVTLFARCPPWRTPHKHHDNQFQVRLAVNAARHVLSLFSLFEMVQAEDRTYLLRFPGRGNPVRIAVAAFIQ